MNIATRLFPVIGAAILLAACDAHRVSGPAPVVAAASPALATVTCTANTISGTLLCGSGDDIGDETIGTNEKKLRPIILGGQNQYVTLTSSNIEVVADTFAFDVTVQNLIPQIIGTTDGSAPDSAGIRVFFATGPTSTGTGSIDVANPDGLGSFTASNQPYFEYSEMLNDNETSSSRRWKLRFDPDVANFTFTVYVSAAVQYPNGYVDDVPYVLTLDPGEVRSLPGVSRTVTGRAQGDELVIWVTDSPATASVFGSTVTAGVVPGFANLTASAGPRPAIHTTAVSVCQSMVVSNGALIDGAIDTSDCFSSYGAANGRPSANYYGDLYRVNLTAGQTLTVTMEGDVLDTYLTLAAHDTGFIVARNDDDPEDLLGAGSRIVYTATEAGTYVIEASTFDGLDTGTYTLGVAVAE